jgi:hypothetical protein
VSCGLSTNGDQWGLYTTYVVGRRRRRSGSIMREIWTRARNVGKGTGTMEISSTSGHAKETWQAKYHWPRKKVSSEITLIVRA